MKLIAGLGNPGRQYEATRHNVGVMVVQRLGARHGVTWESNQRRHWAQASWRVSGTVVRVLYPLRLMNESGAVVAAAASSWKVSAEELLIVCDDVNLPLGTLRLRAQGSDGGHHGLASCLQQLGTEQVPRLRVGVGIEPLPKDLTNFVLSPFTKDEQPRLTQALERAVEACEVWVTQGIEVAMNMSNVRT